MQGGFSPWRSDVYCYSATIEAAHLLRCCNQHPTDFTVFVSRPSPQTVVILEKWISDVDMLEMQFVWLPGSISSASETVSLQLCQFSGVHTIRLFDLRGTSFLLPAPYPLLAKACQDPGHGPAGEDAGSARLIEVCG